MKDIIQSALSTRPKIVVLCGSTKFFREFMRANYDETMAGHIVLSVGFFMHSTDHTKEVHGEALGCTPEQKRNLDTLHLRKIDLADETFILNVGGYVGESTRRELAYTVARGKGLRWLLPVEGEAYLEANRHVLGRIAASFVLSELEEQS